MLLVSRTGLVEEETVEVFHYYGFNLSSLVFYVKLQVLSWIIIMWQYSQFLSTSSCRWLTLLHPPSRIVSHPKDKISTLSSALREGLWHLVGGEYLSRDSFGPLLRQPSTMLPSLSRLEVQVRIFPSLRMRPESISHTSLVFLENSDITIFNFFFFIISTFLNGFLLNSKGKMIEKIKRPTRGFTGKLKYYDLWCYTAGSQFDLSVNCERGCHEQFTLQLARLQGRAKFYGRQVHTGHQPPSQHFLSKIVYRIMTYFDHRLKDFPISLPTLLLPLS